jgi:acetoin utilization deacetylase AcuC-like enzyme
MNVIYHEKFLAPYPTAGVENPNRIKMIYDALLPHFTFQTPQPATPEDLLLVHTPRLLQEMTRQPDVYEVALLAVGAAILTAAAAMTGEPAFGLLRPPGHHASPDSHWGFCFFNNMAIAVERLRRRGLIQRALILDIDLHFGDGTDRFFSQIPEVEVVNIESGQRQQFLSEVRQALRVNRYVDLIGISAGFDTYVKDWGGILETDDYCQIGDWVKQAALSHCQGRRFALLEGGYYLPDLGKNCLALLHGLD